MENVVGIQLAATGPADYALSVILNSPLQIALVLAPVLVLLSPRDRRRRRSRWCSRRCWSRRSSPSILAVSFVIVDGESDWLEGAALLGLYVVIAASFWWG